MAAQSQARVLGCHIVSRTLQIATLLGLEYIATQVVLAYKVHSSALNAALVVQHGNNSLSIQFADPDIFMFYCLQDTEGGVPGKCVMRPRMYHGRATLAAPLPRNRHLT